jgi:hypothetical protein
MGGIQNALIAPQNALASTQNALGRPLFHPGQQPGPFQNALDQYPILQGLGIGYKYSPGASEGNMLEFWPAGETGDSSFPRPTSLDINKPSVEVYSDKTRPIDILGDVVSHYLVNTDPVVKKAYQDFRNSIATNPEQSQRLLEQYQYAQQNEGEKRSFGEWVNTSGMPAYFRGYTFDQWPADVKQQFYTDKQRAQLDALMTYLQAKPGKR